MHKSAILCVIVTLLCCLRAFQLYFSSTQELRSVEGHSWLPTSTKKLNFTRDSNTIDRLKNDSVVLGTASDNMFYFVHVIRKRHTSTYPPRIHTDIISKRPQIYIYRDFDPRDTHTTFYTSSNPSCLLSSKYIQLNYSHADY